MSAKISVSTTVIAMLALTVPSFAYATDTTNLSAGELCGLLDKKEIPKECQTPLPAPATGAVAMIPTDEVHALDPDTGLPGGACAPRPVINPAESQQMRAHCAAADIAKKGISATKGLNTMWFASAGICAVSCFSKFVPPMACYAGAGAAAIMEVMKTHDLMGLFSAVTSNMSMLAPMALLGGGLSKSKKDDKDDKDDKPVVAQAGETLEKKPRSKAPCGLMIYSAFQAMAKKQKMGELKGTLSASESQILALNNSAMSADGFASADQAAVIGTNSRTSATLPTSSGSSGNSNSEIGAGDTFADINGCGGTSSAAIQSCALAKDSSLPDYMKGSEFRDNTEKYMGASLAELNKNNKDGYGAKELSQMLGQGGGGSSSGEIAQGLNDLEGRIASANATGASGADEASATYSRGGGSPAGGSGGAASAEDDPFAQALAGMMGKLNGDKDGAAGTLGVNEIDLSAQMQNRSPAAIAEDRRISLFDRITYRYQVAGKRIFKLTQ